MKFIDLNKQYQKIKNNINKDLLKTLEKGDFIQGKDVFELENKLADYVGTNECITCASGTDALLIPLMAYGIGKGDAVFTTNFSFFATTEVISLVGAKPIFIDINPSTYNINAELLEDEIKLVIKEKKFKPKAIIAVNLFGQLADYTKIEKIAKKYNLILIEDAAQSFGATLKDKVSCSFGNISATSFYPAKPLGCYGDGGAIFTDDIVLAKKCRSLKVHGQGFDKYDNVRIGLNSRLDTLQANVLINKLSIFNQELLSRNKIALFYTDRLKDTLKTPYVCEGFMSSWAQYSLMANSLKERDLLLKHLNSKNIPTAIFYKKIFSDLELYKNDNLNRVYPVASSVSKKIFSIPMHPYLEQKELKSIVNAIKEFYR